MNKNEMNKNAKKIFGKVKIRTKIIVPTILVLLISNFISTYTASYKMENMAKENSVNELRRLSDSIFLHFRTAMDTGDLTVIQKAEEECKSKIDGLEEFHVHKGKKVIELFDPTQSYTTDPKALEVFENKKELIIDKFENNSHKLRILRPAIAEKECLTCHVNQQIGDVIGIFDLTFSLDKSDKIISDTILNLSTQAIVVMTFITLFMMWLIRLATKPIVYFQEGLEAFFRYINKEDKNVKPIDTYSDDEIGDLVKAVNKNIEKAVKGIELDTKVINNAGEVCARAAKGELNVQITEVAHNPEVNQLKNTVNELISAFKYNIDRIIKVLSSYEAEDYRARINSKGNTTGEIKQVFDKIDALGDTLSNISKINLNNGIQLKSDTTKLLHLITDIRNSSFGQSESLKEQKEELDKLTNTIKNSTSMAIKMAEYAKEVTESSKLGLELANTTSKEMLLLNEEIQNISDSISIIDQITLQTNILSLNAAVEASTAGEIGKGFAVVAQEVRNLANKSAEAAKDIKEIVEFASNKSKEGTEISNRLIEGFNKLSNNINNTIELIEKVTQTSKEQKNAVVNISEQVNIIEDKSIANSKLALDAVEISKQTNQLAQTIVEDAKKKKFKD